MELVRIFLQVFLLMENVIPLTCMMGKTIQSGRSDGTQTFKLEYGNNYTIVTNPLGAVSKYIYTNDNKDKLTKIERSGVNNCPNSNAVTNYDNNGYVSSEIDWNGVETTYRRDANGLLLEK